MEDLDFILKQIKFAERHAAGEDLLDILPNATVPWGLRTVDGSFNNLVPGQELFGRADEPIPNVVERNFPGAQLGTTYESHETVVDSTPRLISHMITNQSVDNPAAVLSAQAEEGENIGPDITGADQFFIPNTAPDEGLSAPFNTFMTFFGQFFDHGLGLINKGGNGTVVMPLQPDDPLFDPGPDGDPTTLADNGPNVMIMTRATQDPGPDGIQGTADDIQSFVNATTPHVDQQQTYASHSSAQILLRHYEVRNGVVQSSGRLLDGFGNDRLLDTADDGGLATWDAAQEQALLKLGLILDDLDGDNMPMILADPYGKFIPGPNGLPQLVTAIAADGTPTLVEGCIATPGCAVDATQALRIDHSFFLDVAHTAAPIGAPDPDSVLNARTDMLSGQVTRGIRASAPEGFYDDELLGEHFVCGDGRCNENIALTAVHSIFHREHNRLTNVAKRVLLDSGNLAKLNEWLDTPLASFPAWAGLPFPVSDASLANQAATRAAIDALNLDWNGERIFQAARFGTEMQYNRIVFDEFSPTLAGLKDVFEGFHTNIDPGMTNEFAHSVYRFGHSMLTETVERLGPDFTPIAEAHTGDSAQLGLFEAFLNPLAFRNAGEDGVASLSPEAAAGAIIRGLVRAPANEIDEFMTGGLQNNLVGLPLDLGALNIARGRDVGNPKLNDARRAFWAETQDTRLMPYLHWADYADNLRHEFSAVNFLAGYGTHPTLAGPDGTIGTPDDPVTTFADRRAAACAIVGALAFDATAYCVGQGFGTPPATPADAIDFLFSRGAWASGPDGRAITGLEEVDFWVGGLAEERMPFGGYLGSTHNYIFETQMERLQNGDRFYYVGRTADIHFFSELESNSFTSLVLRNTDLGDTGAAVNLNLFGIANHILEVDQDRQFDAAGDGTTADPVGEDLIPLVIRDAEFLTTNIWMPDTTRVIQYTGGDHVTIGGTEGRDTIVGGIGDDTILGRAGDDRLEGGDGADLIEGGPGDDIITDLSGPDVIEGGPGNDAINSGNEEDVIFGDEGNDFIVNPSELGEIFGGLGDDFILDGEHLGHTRGGAGNDWLENLGGGEDLFQGDNGALAEQGESPVRGHDVAIARGGNNDFDMESGDDIIVDGPGIERAEGQLGFDWQSFQNDVLGVNIDLDLTIFLRPTLPPSNNTILNRYDRVEGISGSPHADILRGTANEMDRGNELVNFDLIDGLGDLVPMTERRELLPDILTGEPQFGWTGGEIILGGAGSDFLAGEAGDDIIDGDAALTVMIRTPDPAIRMGPLGRALRDAKTAAWSSSSQSVADAAAAAAFVEAGAVATAARQAADAALEAALAAQAAADAAVTNALSIHDELGNLVMAALVGPAVQTEWLAFLDSCAAALIDMGLVPEADAAAQTAAEAMAAAAEALENEMASTQEALEAKAVESAAAAAAAQVALAIAQADMDAADEFILVESMRDVMEAVFGGFINPGELSISRVIADEDPDDSATDSVEFQGPRVAFTVTDLGNGFIEVLDRRVDVGDPTVATPAGRDLVRNAERLVFDDFIEIIDTIAPINSLPTGTPMIDGVPEIGQTLTASVDGVTDPDNAGGDLTDSVVDWIWQTELEPGTGMFTSITRVEGIAGNGDLIEVRGQSMVVTEAETGLLLRVLALFKDDEGVLERVISAPILIGTPPTPVCGDGFFDPRFEECDDGNLIDGDGCSAICTIEPGPLCGDGNLDPGEQCDDGNNANGDGCSAGCILVVCGDGVLDPGGTEECDDGNLIDGDGCSSNCTLCGDGIIGTDEVCDDAGESATCNADCTLAICGDGKVNATAGEVCDAAGESATCDLDCTAAVCGDSTINLSAGEMCDDGGESTTCDLDCTIAVCGDGTINLTAGETCDDGGETVACDADCTAAVCGDGVTNAAAGEACDDGNLIDMDGCNAMCQIDVLPNLLVNGDFSAGAEPWRHAHNADVTFSVVGGEAFIDVNTAGTANQLYQSGFAITEGTTYRVTFTVRNTGGSDLRILLLEHESPFTNLGLLQRVPVTTESQVFVYEFVATGSSANARFRLNMGPHDSSGSDYFIDDVSLSEVPGGMVGLAP